ncbi:MAG: HAMP domain-containing sensor histidine kinase [Dehalococcoidia bacterium]
MKTPGSILFSLQTKLIATFVVVVLVAVVLAGAVFVAIRRGEQEQQALDHVIANSPSIYAGFTGYQVRGEAEETLVEYAEAAATQYDVRILLVNLTDLSVVTDTQGDLTDETFVVPEQAKLSGRDLRGRAYISWGPEDGTPGSDLVMVATLPSSEPFPRLQDDYWLVLAVPESTIRRAWQGLLPGLFVAAAIAMPVAVVLGILVSQYISGPLRQLTIASQRIAQGDYDVAVSVDRRDEVGRLAQAFTSMARRVGDAHTQMRSLVANVSHDLKTPLTSILGFSQALRDGAGADDAESRRMGEVIHDEAARLTTRLNDLLLLSEIEAGQTLLQRDEIDLRKLVQSAVERIEPDVRERGVRLDVDLDGEVAVSADGPKLERAIENLLDNARKYTPANGELRVRAFSESGATGDACIEVANTAPDLTPEELPRLFERFYRHDRARAERNGAGSGLGLPIARELVELHGGKLDAELRDGQLVLTARLPHRG